MIAPRDRGEYGGLDERPVLEYEAMTESENAVPARTQARVTTTIGLKLHRVGVVRGAVYLDHESLADDEVHAPHPHDRNLRFRQDAAPRDPEPKEEFRAGL